MKLCRRQCRYCRDCHGPIDQRSTGLEFTVSVSKLACLRRTLGPLWLSTSHFARFYLPTSTLDASKKANDASKED